jgi:hypothetical protein
MDRARRVAGDTDRVEVMSRTHAVVGLRRAIVAMP